MLRLRIQTIALIVGLALCVGPAWGVPEKGSQVPGFRAVDINGREVDLDQIIQTKPDLVILFFFTTSTGEEIAAKLALLDGLYGKDKLRIIAVGWKEDSQALKKFAADRGLQYHVVQDTPELAAEQKYGPFASLPLTFIVSDQKTVLKILSGSGKAEADLITDVAQAYFQKRDLEKARTLAQEAAKSGEPEKPARNLNGFALAEQGKLDEAQAEFGRIDSKEGLAKVALLRGENDQAVAIADQAGLDNGYAQTVKGTALLRTGMLGDAAAAFQNAVDAGAGKPAADWQKAEAQNGLGRVEQALGNADSAIGRYQQAVALDPFNVVALSNEGAALRQKGDLKKAAEVLEKARNVRHDELVAVMLQQVQRELKEANDLKRGELVRTQIADLRQRYETLKAAGKDKPVDAWTSPPMVLAFLPSDKSQTAFLERAGADVALRREIEARLQAEGAIRVVEREVLDKLLQELNLGSSDLANPNTQLQLGKVLSARMLGFVDFATVGADTLMYVRLVDTETTSLAGQIKRNVKDLSNLGGLVAEVAAEIVKRVQEGRPLQGLVADVPSDEAVIINLGKQHGVKAGQQFYVIKDGPPIEAGGKVIGHREARAVTLEVTQVEDQYAVCKVVKKEEGAQLAKEMRVKQVKTP